MTNEEILSAIITFTDNAHGTQARKYSPERYIEHPKRVMATLRQYTDDVAVLAAALMHDVLEDTPVTADDIRKFLFDLVDTDTVERTIGLVIELTDVYVKDKYPKWNRRQRKTKEMERVVKTSYMAQTIKYADIIDNTDAIVYADQEFAGVFLNECKALLKRMNQGNPDLYDRAVKWVDKGLLQLKKNMSAGNGQDH